MKNVVVIVGPTASGKTNISIELAKRINGEIVSADSMQIYRHMNIGTAKPSVAEMQGIKHCLIDEIEPTEEFSVAAYKKIALKYIHEIASQGKTPILCGGTGLYINSVIYNLEFSDTISDPKFREELIKIAKEKGNKYLHDELMKVDPKAAEKIHENNLKRVIRALEVHSLSNTTISEQQKVSRDIPSEFNFTIFGLKMDRKILYERIEARVDKMFDLGLVNEVKSLKSAGLNNKSLSMQAIGYKEVLSYLDGESTLEETVETIKKGTRNYAKRQMTWFKKIENVIWIDVGEKKSTTEVVDLIINDIEKLNCC